MCNISFHNTCKALDELFHSISTALACSSSLACITAYAFATK